MEATLLHTSLPSIRAPEVRQLHRCFFKSFSLSLYIVQRCLPLPIAKTIWVCAGASVHIIACRGPLRCIFQVLQLDL